MNLYYYARNGDEITMEQYLPLFADRTYKIVEQTTVGPYQVSTVWLGLDHSFGDFSKPMIFETMVFTSDSWEGRDPLLDLECRRYSTEEEARTGHAEYVTLLQATTPDIPDSLEKEEDDRTKEQ